MAQLPGLNFPQTEATSDDYLTPRWVFDVLAETFDIDVAASPFGDNVPAVTKFYKQDDGLAQSWRGFIWMNPPYSQATPWVNRFIDHANGIALLPFAKSMWLINIWSTAHAITLPPRRFHFEGGSIMLPVFFAAMGERGVRAVKRIGVTRWTEIAGSDTLPPSGKATDDG